MLCNINNSPDVIIIFGSAHGGWDYTGILNSAIGADIYGIRDQKISWYQESGQTFSGLLHIDEFLDWLLSRYSGKKVFCGVSMGGSASLYFGCKYSGVSVIAASLQLFQYQFLWNQGSRTHHEMIEKLPDRLRRRKSEDIEIIVCGDGPDPEWNWRDKHAADLAEELFGLPINRIPGSRHACWQLFSMREKIEARLGRRLFASEA